MPTALQPLIKQLIDTHQLTDSAGNAIDDLSALKFDDSGDPLATGMSKLTDAITNLGKILSDLPGIASNAATGVGNALANVHPPPITLHYQYVTDNSPPDGADKAASGAFVGSSGLFFDTGGFPGGPSGTDTVPAWLTPGESILNKHATAMLGTETVRGFNAGSTAGLGNVYVNVAGSIWAEQDLSDAIAQRLADRWMQVGGVMPLGH